MSYQQTQAYYDRETININNNLEEYDLERELEESKIIPDENEIDNSINNGIYESKIINICSRYIQYGDPSCRCANMVFDFFSKCDVIPLSKEFSSEKHIQDFYKNKQKNMTNQSINRNTKAFSLEIHTFDDLINYNLDIIVLNMDSLRIAKGGIWLKFQGK